MTRDRKKLKIHHGDTEITVKTEEMAVGELLRIIKATQTGCRSVFPRLLFSVISMSAPKVN